jgi:two-component sensor histidine kinase
MRKDDMGKYVQGSLFEDDFLKRTLGPLSYRPDIAITELVANAWDAGAARVDITIPEEKNGKLIVEDDGIGLTKDEFCERWMKLGYSRLKHQGADVEFPPNRTGKRLAYGRNGVGRHGMLCFNDQYRVITCKVGTRHTFDISTQNYEQPFVLKKELKPHPCKKHGTRLEVVLKHFLPNPETILNVISARFLHDPQFAVYINGKKTPLEDHKGLISRSHVKVNGDIKLELLFIDTTKAARRTLYQGIAFWQGNRLVGEPSWILGKDSVLDGRTKFAKRYTFVAKTNDLADQIDEDWTGFKSTETMNAVFAEVSKHTIESFRSLAKDRIAETKQSIRREYKSQLQDLSPLGKYEVDEVVEHVVDSHPTANQETLGIAVEAVINLEKTRSGKALLQKLSHLSDNDISGLNSLLEQWTIKDALSVLDEIDRRVSVIEAISKLSDDKTIDELKVLHPLVTEARWLFGPEFDSPEYTSNRQLRTVVKKLFGVEADTTTFVNDKKRPDLVVLSDSSVSVTGAEQFSEETNLVEMRRLLIIELKRGGSDLTRDNRNQALQYVEDFMGCRELTGNPQIVAFVVGDTVQDKVARKQQVEDRGTVYMTTFGQLVDTAHRRLFNLKEKLEERYDGVDGVELTKRSKQLTLKFNDVE